MSTLLQEREVFVSDLVVVKEESEHGLCEISSEFWLPDSLFAVLVSKYTVKSQCLTATVDD